MVNGGILVTAWFVTRYSVDQVLGLLRSEVCCRAVVMRGESPNSALIISNDYLIIVREPTSDDLDDPCIRSTGFTTIVEYFGPILRYTSMISKLKNSIACLGVSM